MLKKANFSYIVPEKVNISLFVDLKSTELDVPKTEYGQQLVEYLRGTCKVFSKIDSSPST